MPLITRRILTPALFLLGAAITVWVLAGIATDIAAARDRAFVRAEKAINRVAASAITQHGVRRRLVAQVDALLDDPALTLNYLTLRNADGATLLSRGRFAHSMSWLPEPSARAWRGAWYRWRSAEAERPIFGDGRRIGRCAFGLDWLALAREATIAWPRALLELAVGLAFILGALHLGAGTPRRAPSASNRFARYRQWLTRKRVPTSSVSADVEEFAPIGAATGEIPRASTALETTPRPSPAAVPEPRAPLHAAPRTPPAADRSPKERTKPPTRPDEPTPPPPNVSRPAAGTVESRRADRRVASPEKGSKNAQWGLKFVPIWQGVAEERRMTGGWAMPTDHRGAATGIEAEMPAPSAAETPKIRALSRWIGQRLTMLQRNWRTLELATVPIVLALPGAAFAYPDAEAVWRDALRVDDRDPWDLVLCSASGEADAATLAALPGRTALPLDRYDDEDTTDPNALIYIDPARYDAATLRDRIATLDRPSLVGPVDTLDDWRTTLSHPHVQWFSGAPGAPGAAGGYTPRAFARLMNRYEPAPV